MEMYYFPRTSDVVEGLRYQGYVGPSENITDKIFLSTLAVEKLTNTTIFFRKVTEDIVTADGWIYLSAYNAHNVCIETPEVSVYEFDSDVCAVKVTDSAISFTSRLLGTASEQRLRVTYATGYKDGELPSLYQELILNFIYYKVLAHTHQHEKIESEINRLIEVERAQRIRFEKARFLHMFEQGIV